MLSSVELYCCIRENAGAQVVAPSPTPANWGRAAFTKASTAARRKAPRGPPANIEITLLGSTKESASETPRRGCEEAVPGLKGSAAWDRQGVLVGVAVPVAVSLAAAVVLSEALSVALGVRAGLCDSLLLAVPLAQIDPLGKGLPLGPLPV